VGYLGDVGALRVIDGPGTAPAGTSWSGGALYVSASTLTLDGVYVKGGVVHEGSGVLTIRNSIIEGGYGTWMVLYGNRQGSTIDVRDSTLRWRGGVNPDVGSGNGAIQVSEALTIIALRNDISGTADGLQLAGPNNRIEQNWIHGLAAVGQYPNNTHNDGIQIYNGSGLVIANNRIEIGFDGVHQNAALFFQTGSASVASPRITGNYLQGGGYTLRFEGNTNGAIVQGNVFGPLEGGAWGDAYCWAPATIADWSGNRHVDGSTVPKPPTT
jgi:hypothetical protein